MEIHLQDVYKRQLDENDESNFEYDYGVGFSTEAYQQKRASFEQNGDIESWLAQYQQQPIDREGTVFNPNDMHFFDGNLPVLPCDWAFTTIDPAFGGGDFVAAPICKAYGDKDVYKRQSLPLPKFRIARMEKYKT